MGRGTKPLLVTAITALALMVFGLIDAAGGPETAPSLVLEDPRSFPESQMDSSLREKLSVLRQPAGPEHALPEDVVRASESNGGIPAAGRFARETASTRLFVIPAVDEKVCLRDQNGAGSCAFLSGALDGLLMFSADHIPGLADREVRVAGVAPDGVAEVTVSLRNGQTTEADVRNNVYVVSVEGPPAAVSWKDGAGSRSIPIPWTP